MASLRVSGRGRIAVEVEEMYAQSGRNGTPVQTFGASNGASPVNQA